MEAGSDFHSRYQKLASEYAKVKAQVSVLKKGLLEEQARSKDIKDATKEKDQALRKYEQEMESVNFRNQQLTKRVTILQDELDMIQHKSRSKTKTKDNSTVQQPPSSEMHNHILGEELRSKIEENERLHQQVYEWEKTHEQVVSSLQTKNDSMEMELARHQQTMDEIHEKHAIIVEKLLQDKASLEFKLKSQDMELKETKMRAEACEDRLRELELKLGTRLRTTEMILTSRLPFIDNNDPSLNALNVPAFDKKLRDQTTDLVKVLSNLVKDIVSGLSNYHTYTEQRVQIPPFGDGDETNISSTNKKLAEYLHANAVYLRPLEQAFREFEDSLKQDFFLVSGNWQVTLRGCVEKFTAYVAYLKKLDPYLILSLGEENSHPSCTPSLRAKNEQLLEVNAHLMAVFDQMDQHLCLLNSNVSASFACRQQALENLLRCVEELHCVLKEASSYFNSKVTLGHQVATTSPKLHTTDECVLASMVSLVTSFGKLSATLNSNRDTILDNLSFRTRGMIADSDGQVPSEEIVGQLRQRASCYISRLDKECPPSVPYAKALEDSQVLMSLTGSQETLVAQVNSSQEKITKLQQAREHWMLEFRLLQIKHERVLKKLKALEEGNGDSHDSESSYLPNAVSDSQSVGQLLAGSKTDDLKSCDATEQELRTFFNSRLRDLIVQMQVANSKAVAFHSELSAVQARLHVSDKSKTMIQSQLDSARHMTEELKEELQTTTKNYESQLSTMSEHMASLNEKLTNQRDEIDALKYEITNMSTKKLRMGK